jgi:hypothetical protein
MSISFTTNQFSPICIAIPKNNKSKAQLFIFSWIFSLVGFSGVNRVSMLFYVVSLLLSFCACFLVSLGNTNLVILVLLIHREIYLYFNHNI